ncbi:MAG: hypothetical protein JNK90_08525 [Planctomycetaceae bacterium]|nr:hypothetical protein [Planctomycetaceae bacterium]
MFSGFRVLKRDQQPSQLVRKQRGGRILLLLIIGGAVIGLVTTLGVVFLLMGSRPLPPEEQLEVSCRMIEEGRWDIPMAVGESLSLGSEEQALDFQSRLAFVQGSARVLQINENREYPDAQALLTKASEKLAFSDKVGFPLGYRETGSYLLAWAYFHSRQWNAAMPALEKALTLCPERRQEIMEMMIQVHLNKTSPDFVKAHETLEAWLKQPSLSTEAKRYVELLKAEVFFREERLDDSKAIVSTIPKQSPHYHAAQLLNGRILLNIGNKLLDDEGRAIGTNTQLEEALEVLRILLLSADVPANVKRQASYFSGRAMRRTGRLREALSTFTAIRQRSPKSPEAIASGIEEAEILLNSQNPNGAIKTLENVARDCTLSGEFEQQYITRQVYQTRLFAMTDLLRKQKDFENLVRMAEAMEKLISPSDAKRMQAEAYRDWAIDLQARMDRPVGLLKPLERMPKEAWKMAGEKYAELAQLELISAIYPDIAWEAAGAYRNAELLDDSNEWLRRFLRSARRELQPTGLYQLAGNHFDLGELDKAIYPVEALLRDYPEHPLSYPGRLLAARIYGERDQLDKSSELLTQNLYDGDLSPESDVWRESLLELGKLLYREADITHLKATSQGSDWTDQADPRVKILKDSFEQMMESADRLRESVRRYRDDSRSLQSQYLAGRALMQAAKWPETMVDSGLVTLESQRRQLSQQGRDLLQSALDEFQDLRFRLNEMQERESLSVLHMGLLRSAFFGEADCLFMLERFDEALTAYRSAASRFLNRPEALEALTQVARCQYKLNRPDEAKRTLAQAEQVLQRIPAEHDPEFPRRTRYDRQQWKAALAWLKAW